MTIRTTTFHNGFRIIHERPKSNTPFTSLQVFCDVGSVREIDGMRGVSHFIEHMCFKGTRSIPDSKDIFSIYDKVGAYFNATTTKRYTAYIVKCQDLYFHHCLDVLSDMLLHSIFTKRDMIREEQVVLEENIKNEDDPKNILDEISDRLVYENTPYSEPVDTLAYHKSHFDYSAVVDFYHKYYHPSQMILSIVSNLPFHTIVNIVKRTHFARGEKYSMMTNVLIPKNPPISTNGIQYKIKSMSSLKSAHLSISFKTCSQFSKDKFVLTFLQNVLGGALSSRLFILLREDNGLTYQSEVTSEHCEWTGEFTIYAQMNTQKILQNGKKRGVLPLIVQMINQLVRDGITKEEFVMFKDNLRGKMVMNEDDPDVKTEYNGTEYLLYGEPEKIVPYSKHYEVYYHSISLDDVRKCIRTYFRKERAVVCLLGGELPSLKEIQMVCEKME
jgi:predicted Zn-dependent peptidase